MNDQATIVETLRAFGFANEDAQTGVFEGKVTLVPPGAGNLEYQLLSLPDTMQTAGGKICHKVNLNSTDGGPQIEGRLFRSDNFGIIGKIGFSIYASLVVNEVKTDFKISGIYRDKKRNGEAYKNPLYILAILPPRPNAEQPQGDNGVSEDIPF